MPRSTAQQPQLQPQPQPQTGGAGFLGGAGSSFLGNVATTAAGVVAGSFLFQGIENMMGHHSPSPWGQQSSNFPTDHVNEENTTINNYYGDDAKSSDLHTASYDEISADDDDNGFDNEAESDWI
jgi:hypothetical protein